MDADAEIIPRWSTNGRAQPKRPEAKSSQFQGRTALFVRSEAADDRPLPLRDRLARLLNSVLLE